MQARIKSDIAILIPESDQETTDLAIWKRSQVGCVFALNSERGRSVSFRSLGAMSAVCREPINVHSGHPDVRIAIIANLAPTPFYLDGQYYACVEAFWQSLRFQIDDRSRIAGLDGRSAKLASKEKPYGSHVNYNGMAIPVGTYAHWKLMRLACKAKFEQNSIAREALLATAERPLLHRVRPDSRTIPGVIMADIWMALRKQFITQNRR